MTAPHRHARPRARGSARRRLTIAAATLLVASVLVTLVATMRPATPKAPPAPPTMTEIGWGAVRTAPAAPLTPVRLTPAPIPPDVRAALRRIR